MKRFLLLFFTAILVTSTACKKDNPKLLDPNATISIRPAQGVKLKAETDNPEHLSAFEIVKQTVNMKFQSIYKNQGVETWGRGFSETQRDLNPDAPRLKMFGTDIISAEGELAEFFIIATDVVLEKAVEPGNYGSAMDTIAYIPNATLREAEGKIRAAYAAKDYDKVYKLFDEAYRFTPITAKEWKELKAQGKQ